MEKKLKGMEEELKGMEEELKGMEKKLKGQYYWALSYRPFNFQAKRDSACACSATNIAPCC